MKTKTKVTTILFCTVLLILLVAFFLLAMFIYNEQTAYAEELPSGEVSGDIAETDTAIDENSDDNVLGKYGEIILSVLKGGGDIAVIGTIIGLLYKLYKHKKSIDDNNFDNKAITKGINGIADDCELLKNKIEQILNDNTALLNTLLNNLNTAEGRTTALCQTVAMLVSCSNLPDETKNLLLGTINTALGNKEDKDGDTNDKQE